MDGKAFAFVFEVIDMECIARLCWYSLLSLPAAECFAHNEVKEGYVVVPGNSAKAFNMESQRWAIEHGDFDLDPELNRLIESKAIARHAVASFKTFGTSRIWVHESEVTSHRDLILGEISDNDRWRGRAWILDAGKLHAERGF